MFTSSYWRSGQGEVKRSNFQFHKCQQKSVNQMQLKFRNPIVPFILLYGVSNMFKMHLIKHYPYGIFDSYMYKKKTKCRISQLFIYQAQIGETCSSWCVLQHNCIFSKTIIFLISKNIFCWKFVNFLFFILRHSLQRNWLNLQNCFQESDSYRYLFCTKISRTWRHL